MLILGLVLLYKIIWDRDEATFTGRFWQFAIAILLTGLGIMFLLSAPIERVTFNKKTNLLYLEKISVICRKNQKTWSLSEIETVKIQRRGKNDNDNDTMGNDTIHFKIIVKFSKGKPIEILEKSSKESAMETLSDIKTFLATKLAPEVLDIDDEGFNFT